MDFVSEPPQPYHPYHPDATDQRQREIHYRTVELLRTSLPPMPGATAEDVARRDRVALATVASLVTANPAEARLAALHVAATEHAAECMLQAGLLSADDPKSAGQLRAQAASMGREARGYLGVMLRLQRVREKREANDGTRDSAAMTEHCTLGLMTDALDSMPPLPPVPARAPRPPAPAVAAARAAAKTPAAPAEQPRLLDYDEWPEEEKQKDRLRAKADRYAILHRMEAKLIRQHGGLPPNCDFEPPEPEVLHAIITGDTSNLRWVDTYEPWVAPAK